MYQQIIATTLQIAPARARLVEGYLRLQYKTLDHLSREDIRREYVEGGIAATIDDDPAMADRLASTYSL